LRPDLGGTTAQTGVFSIDNAGSWLGDSPNWAQIAEVSARLLFAALIA
jgi:hypothetical protein